MGDMDASLRLQQTQIKQDSSGHLTGSLGDNISPQLFRCKKRKRRSMIKLQ